MLSSSLIEDADHAGSLLPMAAGFRLLMSSSRGFDKRCGYRAEQIRSQPHPEVRERESSPALSTTPDELERRQHSAGHGDTIVG